MPPLATHGAVICMSCGYNSKTGAKVAAAGQALAVAGRDDDGVESPGGVGRAAGRFGVVLVAGAAASLIGSGVWAGIGIATGYEIGWVAWGIGALVGVVMATAAKEQSARLGLAAAGMALAGLLVGKVLLIQWGGTAELAKMMKESPSLFESTVHKRMEDAGEIDAELKKYFDSEDFDPDSPAAPEPLKEKYDAFVAERSKRVAALSPKEKDDIAYDVASTIVGSIPWGEKLRLTMSPFDALWLFLSLGTAWKMGTGGGGGDD